RGTGRPIDADEAKAILRMAEEAGLVHLTENKAGVGTVICNCCGCCCIGLPFAKNAETRGMLVPSRYLAVVEVDVCTGCGMCVDECPVEAIVISSENCAQVNRDICIGCGVCTHVCPVDALYLSAVRGEDFIPS
ncbi:MAG: 4Fe-4S binding protein, partial [Desulfomonilia bacterium]|nr:4Fe-4S binding protein [Desulfomonilia bacterium]